MIDFEVMTMKFLAVIHAVKENGKIKWYCYDILCKPSLIEKKRAENAIETLKKIYGDFISIKFDGRMNWYEYRTACGVARKYERKGWMYLSSGDTAHCPEVLRELGIKSEQDLEGLKTMIKRSLEKLGEVKIVVEG